MMACANAAALRLLVPLVAPGIRRQGADRKLLYLYLMWAFVCLRQPKYACGQTVSGMFDTLVAIQPLDARG